MLDSESISRIAKDTGSAIREFIPVFLERHADPDLARRSWSIVQESLPVSAESIKMLADTVRVDRMDLLALQFYDTHYNLLTSGDNKKKRKRNISNDKHSGHCLAFVATDKENNKRIFGQTWDSFDWYPSLVRYTYPTAHCITYPGVLGGPFVSKHKYGTTWCGIYPETIRDGIPTPLLLYEAMNHPKVTNARDFMQFEQRHHCHSGGHGILAVDPVDTYYLERDKGRVMVDTIEQYPFAHSNEFSGYGINSDTVSGKRCGLITRELLTGKRPIESIITTNTKKPVSVWYTIDSSGYYTQGAFLMDIYAGTITQVYPDWRANRKYVRRTKKIDN